jgi:hypothetical protein
MEIPNDRCRHSQIAMWHMKGGDAANREESFGAISAVAGNPRRDGSSSDKGKPAARRGHKAYGSRKRDGRVAGAENNRMTKLRRMK